MKPKIINIFGGPGTGKSTLATGLFSKMKKLGYSCEYISEVAKKYAWEDDVEFLEENQLYVFAQQVLDLKRPLDTVDYVITDAPLLQFIAYTDDYPLKRIILSEHYKFNNINFYINNTSFEEYENEGRYQNTDEAIQLNNIIYSLAINNCEHIKEVERDVKYKELINYIEDYERTSRE